LSGPSVLARTRVYVLLMGLWTGLSRGSVVVVG
jgi:hypothetical protein